MDDAGGITFILVFQVPDLVVNEEEVYEDEDDENEEGNWRNDYPDEDGEDGSDREERYGGRLVLFSLYKVQKLHAMIIKAPTVRIVALVSIQNLILPVLILKGTGKSSRTVGDPGTSTRAR